MRLSPPGDLPSELELLSHTSRLRQEEAKQIVAKLGEIYLRKARLAPDSVSAPAIGLLRRSDWAPLRAAAVVLWSRRRPRAFLRVAERFFRDEVEVRCAVLEGLANAAILGGLGPDSPPVAGLLTAAARDPEAAVREAARETTSLLDDAPKDDG